MTVAIEVDAFAPAGWRKILRDKNHPGMLVRSHLEVCVFSCLAAELRSGDIAVAGSDSHANLHDQLMSWEECQPLADAFCAQAGIPSDPATLTAHYRSQLTAAAARVDAGYPSNTDLVLEGGRPVLRRRKGADRRLEALRLEAAIHDRLPHRALLDILTRTAYLLGWHHHFGPASGSNPKIRDTLARYVLTVFAQGTLLGPAQVAAHMRSQVSVHELTLAANKHATAADTAASRIGTSPTRTSPTQGQSLPVFGLAALLGFDLLPRIRNWHDLVFYRPYEAIRYQHIDELFGDETVDWALIEAHWPDLLRTAISIRENRMSSVTLLRRLGNHSRKNRLYRAFRELGRAIRTITLLRYLSEPGLRDQIAQVTNRNEAFTGSPTG